MTQKHKFFLPKFTYVEVLTSSFSVLKVFFVESNFKYIQLIIGYLSGSNSFISSFEPGSVILLDSLVIGQVTKAM